jgi:serine/threonine protein kinase
MTLAPGVTLQQHRYVIREILTQGDLRVTYLADHICLEQKVRLESVKADARAIPGFEPQCQSLLNNARLLFRCRHPHMVGVIDAFVEDALPYVAFTYPEGVSLQTSLQVGKPLPLAVAIANLRQVGEAVSLLHAHGIIHGNIRPKTIVRSPMLKGAVLTGITLKSLAQRSMTATLGQSDRDRVSDDAPEPGSLSDQKFQQGVVEDTRALAQVLWMMLTAQPVPAEVHDAADLAAHWRQVHPAGIDSSDLETKLIKTIAQGLFPPASGQTSVAAWLSLLPDVSLPLEGRSPAESPAELKVDPAPVLSPAQAEAHPLSATSLSSSMQAPELKLLSNPETSLPQAPAPQLTALKGVSTTLQDPVTQLQDHAVAPTHLPPTTWGSTAGPQGMRQSHRTTARPRMPALLGMTALVAGFAGAGAGLAMRLNANLTPRVPLAKDAALFNREQGFPASQQWPGQSLYDLDSTAGYLFEQPNRVWTPGRPSFVPAPIQPSAPIYPDPYTFTPEPEIAPTPEVTPFENGELQPEGWEEPMDSFYEPEVPRTGEGSGNIDAPVFDNGAGAVEPPPRASTAPPANLADTFTAPNALSRPTLPPAASDAAKPAEPVTP